MTDMIYFSTCDSEIPRIVAAKLKRQLKCKIGFNDCSVKPRISGDLRIVDRSFRHLRYAEVHDGSLILYRYVGNNKVLDYRIPLYNLNINLDSPKYYCQFSLSKFGEITPIATFQVVKEQSYKKWLKALAVEVIRQTPLNTLKFMDILFINELLEKRQEKRSRRTRVSFLREDDQKFKSNQRIFDRDDSLLSANPLNDSSHDLNVSRDDSQCDSFDKHKSNYSVDSGYCSLQSGCGKSEQSESETETQVKSKPFEELFKKFELPDVKSRSKPRKHVSRYNLLTKFKLRSNSNEYDNKINESPVSDCTSSPNGSESALEFDSFDSLNDKENRAPKNNEQVPSIEVTETIENFPPNIKLPSKRRSASQSNIEVESPPCMLERIKSQAAIPDVLKDLPDTLPRTKRKQSVSFQLPEEMIQNENANALVRLLTKCQIDKEYVPVREKRMLFESLSRFSFSMDNLRKRIKSENPSDEPFLKYRSLSDLNKSHVPVSVMKKYFESFNETEKK